MLTCRDRSSLLVFAVCLAGCLSAVGDVRDQLNSLAGWEICSGAADTKSNGRERAALLSERCVGPQQVWVLRFRNCIDSDDEKE